MRLLNIAKVDYFNNGKLKEILNYLLNIDSIALAVAFILALPLIIASYYVFGI